MINLRQLAPHNIIKYAALHLKHQFNAANTNSQLRQIIQNTRSINEFLKIFSEHREEFQAETFTTSSKTICRLISNHHDTLEFNLIKEVLQKLNTIETRELSDSQISPILSILRNLNQKGVGINAFRQLKDKLISRMTEQLQSKDYKITELNLLLSAFYELFFFKNRQGCKYVTQKIQGLLVKNQKMIISNAEKSFLFFCLSQKSELSREERNIRKIVLKKVFEEFPRTTLTDLAKIMGNFPKIDTIDMDFEQLGTMNLVLTKLALNISELDQVSIYDLIKIDFKNKYDGFSRVYGQILNNVFEQIEQNGQCKLNQESVVKIFHHLSDKVDFFKFSDINKKKLIGFMEKYIVNDQKRTRREFILSKVESLILNGCLTNQESKNRLVKVIADNDIPIKARIIFHMAVKGYNIEPLFSKIKDLQIDQSKSIFLVKLLITVHRIKDTNPEAKALYEKLYSKIEELMSTPESFVILLQQITNSYNKEELNLYNFNYVVQKTFQKLPSPFESEQTKEYKEAYLQYMLNSYSLKETAAFFYKNITNITDSEFSNVIDRFLYTDQRYIKPTASYTQFVQARLTRMAIESKSKDTLDTILSYIAKYLRFAVYRELSHFEEHMIFDCLHNLIKNFQVLRELDLSANFCYILERYITSNYKTYKFQHAYKNFIFHCLRDIKKFSSRDRLTSIILQEGLNLGIVNKNHLEHIEVDKIMIGFLYKARLSYLKDNTFVPTLQRVKPNTLKVVLTNPNMEDYMQQNEAQIIQIIKKSYSHDLVNYLVIFKQQINAKTVKIFSCICQTIAAKINKLDKYDLVGMSQALLVLSNNSLFQSRKLIQKISEDAKYFISTVSLQTHIELIRLFTAQSGLNLNDYYNYLTDYVHKGSRSDGCPETLFYRLSATSYVMKQKDLKLVHKIISKNAFYGLYFFLMNESKYEKSVAESIIEAFVKEVKKPRPQNKVMKPINKIFYDYIKAKYPQQTEQLNITYEGADGFRFSYKPRKELLPILSELSGIQPEVCTGLGQNYIVKMKNNYFVFLWDKKLGAYHEHYFLKRAVTLLMKLPEEANVVCIGSINFPSTLIYLNKQCPKLFIESKYSASVEEYKRAKELRTGYKKQDK